MKWSILVLGIAAAVAGCKNKETQQQSPPPASGSGAAPVPPPAQRPSQLPLAQLPPLELPADPKRAEKVELGNVLFFDQRLSANNDRACYSCHKNEDGNGGHDPIAIGSGNKPQTRHAPVIWNVGYFKNSLYWDGRAATLEDNAKAAWGGGNMGVGKENLDKKAAEIAKIPGYKKLFDAAFPGTEIKADQVAQAVSEYERTLICNDTRYDKFAAGDKSAINDQEQRGLDIFLGKGMCVVCHAPPFFTTAMGNDNVQFYNVGIGTDVVPESLADIGRMKVTNNPGDWAAFKPPSLRNVTKSAPYFHNGSVAELERAVRIMSIGGLTNKNKSTLLADRGLTDAERADLIAFLGTLDCPGKLEAPAQLPK
jgi:cytochrome c peroxidase